ncbi:MAG: hypothetical protein ACPGVG_09480 [Mycobacterium sp.]
MIPSAITSDEMDAQILDALTRAGGLAAWSDIQEELPDSDYWTRVEAAVRLYHSGQVHSVKVAGRTYMSLPLTI